MSNSKRIGAMEHPADFQLLETDGRLKAELTGDWTSRTLGDAPDRLRGALSARKLQVVDLRSVGRCDTSGAYAVVRAAGDAKTPIEARPETRRLIELVSRAREQEPPPQAPESVWNRFLVRLGRGIVNLGWDVYETLAFNGRILVAMGRLLANPKRFRWAPTVSLAERAGLDALPIVGVTSFFIGAVVGLLGAHMLAQFGAQVFAVELGRHRGAARVRHHHHRRAPGRALGLLLRRRDRLDEDEPGDRRHAGDGGGPVRGPGAAALHRPAVHHPPAHLRGGLAGLLGGLLVLWAVLDLSPDFFFQRIVDQVGVQPFWIGLSKAPVMAIVIAGIGCRQGMEVGGDVESLGRRVTAAVVHAIFSIIMIDAVFALVFMEANI